MANSANGEGEYFRHYTDKKGIQGINDTKTIHASKPGPGRDARHGEGVYVTSLPPGESDKTLVTNNYGRNYKNKADLVSYDVRIRKSDLPQATKVDAANGRDVYMTPTAIDLNKVPHTFEKR